MNYTIRITLQSDLCVGSGYSYAGVIDSDVTHDRCGFPYIPARRLKGCMREAAEMITVTLSDKDNTVKALFGDREENHPGQLRIGNAYLENYAALVSAADNAGFRQQYPMDDILQQFTSVRAQTKIGKDGIAQDNALRFTRVINRRSPWAKQDQPDGLVFLAEVTCPDGEENRRDLEQILRATRAIGMHRNRGLGRVTCRLEERQPGECSAQQPMQLSEVHVGDQVEIWYTITNQEPLMISQDSDNVSETYIPGRMVLGALAANYLATAGTTAEDEEFRALFLNGTRTQFLNAYIADETGCRCYPVPGYIRQLKKSKELVNYERVADAPSREDVPARPAAELAAYGIQDGNQPKALSGIYCRVQGPSEGSKERYKVYLKETDRQLTYHHRHENKQRGDQVQLYSHLEIAEGQHFVGVIRTSADLRELVVSLLEQGLQIGKSRNAQYGKCTVRIKDAEQHATVTINPGQTLLVSFHAPAILTEKGQEVIDYKTVYDMVARTLQIDQQINGDYQTEKGRQDGRVPFSMLDNRLIHGYQSIWGLRRTPVAAITEGSVLAYCFKDDAEPRTLDAAMMLGDRQLEGFGEIHLVNMERMGYELIREDAVSQPADSQTVDATDLKMLTDAIDYDRILEQQMRRIREEGTEVISPGKGISPATLGRITLMLRESIAYSKDANVQYQNFKDRVGSIKGDASTVAQRYADLSLLNPDHLRDCVSETDSSRHADLSRDWGTIAMEGLVCRKYRNKREGRE